MTDTKKKPDDNQDNPKAQEAEEKDQAIPKHRFDEVNDKYKEAQEELAEIKAKAKELEEKDLSEKEEWKTLADKKAKEVEEVRTELNTTKIRSAVEREASKLGAVDPADVYKFIDSDQIKINDKGEVEGAEEAVKGVLEAKPYLKNSKTADNIGSGSNPDTKEEKTYSIAWVRERWADVPWTRQKHDAHDGLTGKEFLNKIEKEGRIDYSS
jgi:ferredoxin-like protein FixX